MSAGSRPKSTELSRRPRQPEKCGGRLSQTRAAVVIGAAQLPRKLCSIVGERHSELCNYAIAGESTRIIADILSAISKLRTGCCSEDARKSASNTSHHRRYAPLRKVSEIRARRGQCRD